MNGYSKSAAACPTADARGLATWSGAKARRAPLAKKLRRSQAAERALVTARCAEVENTMISPFSNGFKELHPGSAAHHRSAHA
jgi:hypothetical protein